MSSGLLLIGAGLVLALSGVWSIRLAVTVAAAGSSWLLADAFGASFGTELLVAGAGGVLGLLLAVLAAKALFFTLGAVVGAVVGARLFILLDRGEASTVLALIFVPAVAGCCGVMASRWRQRFLGWATAIAGAALVLTGLGRIAPGTLGFLADGESAQLQALSMAVWVLAAAAARWFQIRVGSRTAPPGVVGPSV